MASFGDGYRWHVTGLTHNDYGFPTNEPEEIGKKHVRLVRKVDRFRDDIVKYDLEQAEDAEILVVSYGCVSRSAVRAVREARAKGIKVGHFRPITLWPFPDKELVSVGSNVKKVIVPELNCGQMLSEVRIALGAKAEIIPSNLVNGEILRPHEILATIEEVA